MRALLNWALVLCLAGFAPSLLAQETPPPPPPPPTEAPAAEPAPAEAPPACSDCHDLAKNFVHNPHARGQLENGAVPQGVCETCHGDATEHAQTGDPTKITVPRGFEGAENTCLLCHDTTTDRKTHKSGMHANSPTVNCLSCHAVHGGNPQLLAKPQPALCGSCHSTQVASMKSKPYAHRIGRAGFGCTSCHEPHGRPGRNNNLRLTSSGERPCYGCHSDKRGPFVFNHAAGQIGECVTCHEPHGSSNPKQLVRANVWQLCLECHSPMTHDGLGSQPPAFHNLSTARYQNCTTCHVAVHGSNRSPVLLK